MTKRKTERKAAQETGLPEIKLLTSPADMVAQSTNFATLAKSHGLHYHAPRKTLCGGDRVRVFRGYGKKKYDLPTVGQLIEGSVRYITRQKRLQEQHAAQLAGKKGGQVGHGEGQTALDADESATTTTPLGVKSVTPESLPFDGTGPALLAIAGGIGAVMDAGRFKSRVARIFGPLKGEINWALNHMDESWEPVWKSLGEDHLLPLERIFLEAMPEVCKFIEVQYPDASPDEVLDAAAAVLHEQVAEILSVLSIWGDCAAQQRDGLYPELKYVVQMVRAAFNLMRTGDITGKGDAAVAAKIQTIAFQADDKMLARYADSGRSTIPGAKGPVGAHVINVDYDESEMLTTSLACPYAHEARHNWREDVVGLPEQQTETAVGRVLSAHQAGKYTLSCETYKIGKQEVPAIALLAQIFGQTLSEKDADIPGGTLLTGPAYSLGYHGVFGALNSRGRGVFNTNRFLRTHGFFLITENGELVIEPHMIDFVRGLVIGIALRNRGFETEAKDSDALSRQAVGLPLPKTLTWVNMDSKSKFKFKIEIPLTDLLQVAETVVDSIINDKLPCLGGLSAADLCDFTKHHQSKVELLVENLVKGDSTVPADTGDFYPTFVAAAAVTALWKLVKEKGMHPVLAIKFVERHARSMLDTIAERAGDKPLVVDPEETTLGDPGAVTPAPTVPAGNGGDGSTSKPDAPVPPARDTDAV
jgi:hypothetical protein